MRGFSIAREGFGKELVLEPANSALKIHLTLGSPQM